MKRLPWIALAAALVIPTIALADPGEGSGAPVPGARAAHRAARAEVRLHRRLHARQRDRARLHLLRQLDLTEGQKALVKTARQETASVRESLRQEIRALREAARSGERTPETRKERKAQAKAAIARAAEQVRPQAQVLLDALSREQRAVLEAAAARHGKTLDDARLLRAVERMLLRETHRGGKHRRGADVTPGTTRAPAGR